jgi:PAS domain S-box-containing protein
MRGTNLKVSISVLALLLTAVIVLTYKTARRVVDSGRWVAHTHEVIGELESVISGLRSEESGVRYFMITGRKDFIGPCREAAQATGESLTRLKVLLADNPVQMARLSLLQKEEQARLDQMDAMTGTRRRIAASSGLTWLDGTRRLINVMESEENRLLELRARQEQEASRQALFSISFLCLLTLGLFAIAIRMMTSENQALTRYARFFSLSVDMFGIADFDGHFKEVSDIWETVLGYPKEELLRRPYLEFVHPDDRPKTSTEAAKNAEGITTLSFENRYRCKDGSYKWLLWNTRAVPEERLIYAVARDITGRKKIEELLQVSEERFRLIVDGIKDYAILMLSPDGVVQTWNTGAERIKGYQGEEIIGNNFSLFYTPEAIQDGLPRKMLQAAAAEGRHEQEGWRVRKDGSRFMADTVITALRDKDGELRGFAKITRDVTERKRTENSLRDHAKKLEQANLELDAFSYSVSHDLRSPLRAIDGFSEILQEEYAPRLDAEGQRLLGVICNSARQMGKLIDDLLAFSRLGRKGLETTPVDMEALADSVVSQLKALEPERAIVIERGMLPAARGDIALLQQAVANLVSNALKFTRRKPDARVEIGSKKEAGGCVYYVADNGAGFDMQYSKKLFGVFQRLHGADEFEGTGIGLALVQRIITRHGGRVWAEGKLGEGATFYFTLPDSGGDIT